MSFASVWPWAIAAAIVGIVICVVIAVIVLRAARAKVPMIPASAAPPPQPGAAPSPATTDAGVAAALGIRRSFSEAKHALKEQTSSLADRNSIPWVLSLGEVGSGKSTFIASLDLPRLPGVAHRGNGSHAHAVEWAFYENGIIIDAAGSMVLDPSRSPAHADDRAWHALLAQLNRHRPERPLDALILSIPCTDLVGPHRLTREALGAKATKLGDRVAELQHTLSLRLPVYVVITKCDTIPGFTAFCHAMPPKRLDDMLGWSSPYTVDAAFAPTWIDEALDEVLRGLQEAEFAALAREDVPTDGEALFLLPMHLGRTRSPLREFLQRVFRPTTYERGSFLRGIYFTGDRSARPEADEPTSATSTPIAAPTAIESGDPWALPPDEAPAAAAVDAPRHPAFLADLFAEKIFAERGLAQPGARVFPSKNKLVARMQIAAAAIVLLAPYTLYGAVYGFQIGPWRITRGIKAEAAGMQPLLQNIDGAVREMQAQRDMFRNASNETVEHVSVFQLLDNMATMRTNHMWSVFLPGTLLSPLHRDITDAIGLSFQTIILPEFHDRLAYRARRLVDPAGTKSVSEDSHYGEGLSLPQYLDEVNSLSANVDRFNQLAEKDKGELEDLAKIVQYLYGEQMAPDFLQDAGYYRQALSEANTRPVQIDSTMRLVALRRAGLLTRESYTALLRRLTGTEMVADSDGAPAAASADVAALAGLRAFLDTAGPVERALDGVHPPFAFGNDFAARVRDSLTFYTGQLTGQLLPRYTDAAHSSEAIIRALDALLRQPFMQAPATRPLTVDATAGADLSWDVARLDEAIALRTGFNTFMARGLDPLPDVLRNRVRGLATMQLGAAMTDAIASAAHVGPANMSFADRDRDLEARVAAFDQSAPRLTALLAQLDSIGATSTYDALLDATTVNAGALLARVAAQLELPNRYRLPPAAVAGWNGRAPFSANGFGGRAGALDAYFAGEQDALRSAAKLARPVVAFLDQNADDAARRAANLRTWDAVLDAVDQLDKKPPGGPIIAMEESLRLQLDSIDVRDCARRAPRGSTGTDVFSQRADAMWSTVWRRCVDISNRELNNAYARLQSTFRSRLAGRFPFAAPDARAEALPADVAAFLRDYDAFVAIAKQSGPPDAPFSLLGTRADVFLTDIGRVRTLFAAYLDSAAAGRPPLIDYQVDFRVNRAREAAANQIAEWTADIGDQEATIGAPVNARRGRWRAGDDIHVTLRWATGSNVAPTPPAPDGATLGDGSVTFDASGEWSLLRLLRRYESDTQDPDGGQTLKFTVPTGRRGSSAGATGGARAFIRVRLYNPDTKAEIAMPRFPTTAPDLGDPR